MWSLKAPLPFRSGKSTGSLSPYVKRDVCESERLSASHGGAYFKIMQYARNQFEGRHYTRFTHWLEKIAYRRPVVALQIRGARSLPRFSATPGVCRLVDHLWVMKLFKVSRIAVLSVWTSFALSLDVAQWSRFRTGASSARTNLISGTDGGSTNATIQQSMNDTTTSLSDQRLLTYICFDVEGQTGPPNIDSCSDAIRQLDIRSSNPAIWGRRNDGRHYQIPLPQRYVSADGRCYLEPLLREGYGSSITSVRSVALAGVTLLQKCVSRTPAKNGAAKNIGDDGRMAVVVSGWDPKVQCLGPIRQLTGQFLNNCREILHTMNVDERDMRFGPASAPGGVDVVLPTEVRGGYLDPCILTVRTSGPADVLAWKLVWDASTAINAMCIQQGRSGVWNGLGSLEQVSVQMSDIGVAQE